MKGVLSQAWLTREGTGTVRRLNEVDRKAVAVEIDRTGFPIVVLLGAITIGSVRQHWYSCLE